MCTLEYVTDFIGLQTFIDHMAQVLQLEDKEAFVKGMDKQVVLQYLIGIAIYAEFELALGEEIMDVLFAPLKVADIKQFTLVLTCHAHTFFK